MENLSGLTVKEMQEIEKKAVNKNRLLVPSQVNDAFINKRNAEKTQSRILLQLREAQIKHTKLEVEIARKDHLLTQRVKLYKSHTTKLKNTRIELKQKSKDLEDYKRDSQKKNLEVEAKFKEELDSAKAGFEYRLDKKEKEFDEFMDIQKSLADSDKKELTDQICELEKEKSALDRTVSKKSCEIKKLRSEVFTQNLIVYFLLIVIILLGSIFLPPLI